MPTRGYSKYQNAIILAGDILLLMTGFMISYYIRQDRMFLFDQPDYVVIFLVYVFSWWIISNNVSVINTKRAIRIENILLLTMRNTLLHVALIYLAMAVFKFYGISRLTVFYAFIFELVFLILWRIIFFNALRAYRKAGYNFRHVAILGTNKRAIEVYKNIASSTLMGYKFIGFFEDESIVRPIGKCPIYPLAQFETIAKQHDIDEIFCALDREQENRIRDIISYCEHNLIRFKLVPSFQQYIRKKVTIDFVNGIPIVLLRQEPLESLFARFMKRAFDVVFSLLIILCVFSWLFPIIALLIKIESRGPVFFTQLRTGKDNNNFNIIKFRSMTVNTEANMKQATKNDSRLTSVGRFIRKTNIDELPQFFNVLKGDMSVVGPRPHMLLHTKQYSEIINKYMVRHLVKPGITGWAQVNGFRGETSNPLLMEQRVEHDVWYLENWTFILDLVIIGRTIINMVTGEKNAG